MRYIHRVALKEKFVASGLYTYYLDGQPTGAVEHWSIHEQTDSALFVRADYDARNVDGTSLLLQALVNPEHTTNAIERFDLYFYTPTLEAKAYYSFFDNYVQVGRAINKGQRIQTEVAIDENVVVNPLSKALQNFVLWLAQKSGEAMPVLSPNLHVENAEQTLALEKQICSAAFVDSEMLQIGDKTYPTRRYVLECENRSSANFWFDDDDILLRHECQNQSVSLSRYSRRPPVTQ
ncbi:MAG: hypothetical protein D6737_08185 [Chloroflexi bacterium]|nr:MAG: hypothetical protein CUN54_03570 [Phototrophicales bacterium]RMF80350.1 MAG: hypothetical protein D6737_08185 [Chloroflexota bacterium]